MLKGALGVDVRFHLFHARMCALLKLQFRYRFDRGEAGAVSCCADPSIRVGFLFARGAVAMAHEPASIGPGIDLHSSRERELERQRQSDQGDEEGELAHRLYAICLKGAHQLVELYRDTLTPAVAEQGQYRKTREKRRRIGREL